MLLLCCIAIVSLLFSGGYGLPGGPPISSFRDRICDQLLPNHGGTTPQTGNGNYFILSDLINDGGAYTAGQSYSLQLLGTANTFRGFLIQAREGGNYIGSFTNLPDLTQTLNCDASNPQATVSHMNPGRMDFSSLNFTWEAPSGSGGTVTFMYTAMQAFATYHAALNAAQERPPTQAPPAVQTIAVPNTAVPSTTVLPSTATPTVPSTTMLPSTTAPPTAPPTLPPTTMPPPVFVQPDPPNVSPEDYRLTSRNPAGCTPTVDCSYFVGIQTNTNSSFLDIYLEGNSQGWVAVGFSPTEDMLSADVLGCNRMDQTEEVYVVDTWNPSNLPRWNVLDANQDGVFAHSAEFINGRISCSFSRYIGVVNPNQDLNLNGEYFLLFGEGERGGGMGSFRDHRPQIPPISTSQVNPVTDEGPTISASQICVISLVLLSLNNLFLY